MNGEQQRTHKTAIEELAKSVDTIMGKFARDTQHGFNQMTLDLKKEASLRNQGDQFLTDRIQAHQNEIEELRQVARERWELNGQTFGRVFRLTNPLTRPFWGRMRWLLTGK